MLSFLALAARCGVLRSARRALAQGQQALAILKNRDLDESAKERAVRAQAGALFRSFLAITVLSAVALVVPLSGVWIAAACGLVSVDAVLAALVSWQLLLGALAAWIAWWLLRRRSGLP